MLFLGGGARNDSIDDATERGQDGCKGTEPSQHHEEKVFVQGAVLVNGLGREGPQRKEEDGK